MRQNTQRLCTCITRLFSVIYSNLSIYTSIHLFCFFGLFLITSIMKKCTMRRVTIFSFNHWDGLRTDPAAQWIICIYANVFVRHLCWDPRQVNVFISVSCELNLTSSLKWIGDLNHGESLLCMMGEAVNVTLALLLADDMAYHYAQEWTDINWQT